MTGNKWVKCVDEGRDVLIAFEASNAFRCYENKGWSREVSATAEYERSVTNVLVLGLSPAMTHASKIVPD